MNYCRRVEAYFHTSNARRVRGSAADVFLPFASLRVRQRRRPGAERFYISFDRGCVGAGPVPSSRSTSMAINNGQSISSERRSRQQNPRSAYGSGRRLTRVHIGAGSNYTESLRLQLQLH